MSGAEAEWELFTLGNSFLPSPLFFVDFMRVSSPDFRGIFQTILKKAVFSVTSAFLSIFYKRADFEGHAFLQILVFCLFWQPHFKPTASYRPHSMTAIQPSWLHAASIAETFSPYRDAYNKQFNVQCTLVVRVFPPIRIALPLSSRKCRPRHKPRLSHPAIRATARLT